MHLHDEQRLRKIVVFNIVYTCTYFPLLLSLLIWTKGINTLGKYGFQPFLFIIMFAETAKYFTNSIYFSRHDYNPSKKTENSFITSISRLIFNRMKLKEGAKTLFTMAIMTLVFFAIAVLFGAEIFDKHEETLMFSALLSVLTVLPVSLNQGNHYVFPILLGVRADNLLETMILQNVHLTLIGAWLGAIAIPLDWDRPWQVWPIPCSLGAMAGYVASHVIMLHRLRHNMTKKYR